MADSFCNIISLWPSVEALADDVGAARSAVRKWWQRDRIPSEWWKAVLGTKIAKRNGVTADRLAALAAREREELRA